MKHVFIIGSKGIPSNYGGFETFVDKLTEYNKDTSIKYHVSCLSDNFDQFEYNNAHCFNIRVPNIGPAKAIYYDVAALKYAIKYIKNNNINNAIVYILACRIGPFIGRYKEKLNKLEAKLFVNPDGHEWKRAKWNYFIKKYWKWSEKLMVKHADLLICDSKTILEYIKDKYKQYHPQTTYISYGADVLPSNLENDNQKVTEWFSGQNIQFNNYYLLVGRFVPENNYETIIREFMKSKTDKELVIITNVENNKLYNELSSETNFDTDKRIKFVGTVYDKELLKKIREEAFAYIHGHEVGGTNPSLLEALASTKLNLILNVGFNREVGGDAPLYWDKEYSALSELINRAESLSEKAILEIGNKSVNIIKENFTWINISAEYTKLFLQEVI